MKMTISLAQINIALGDTRQNVLLAEQMIERAAGEQSDMILFPELWTSGYDLEKRQLYAHENQTLNQTLSQLARDRRIWIGGSWITEHKGKFFNAFHLFDHNGQNVASYRKIHLFRLMHEDQWLSAGDHLQIVETPWGKLGLAICYDLRFPEMFRYYALAGAEIILLVAQWPARRAEHWKTLIRARAIENQLYLVAMNCVGIIGKETFGGASAIIDPWGRAVIEGEDQPALFTAQIDLNEVQRVREWMPVFRDRRSDIYGNEKESKF
ncbi:MAG: carbon-nitrogen family hydrolase [Anaerolineales bacterium]